MKLTVSNTVMMNPLLHLDERALSTSPPQRVVGLLENIHTRDVQPCEPQKILQYDRPDRQSALLQSAKWQDFLLLDNAKNRSYATVFGFEFDGIKTWYQVWNRTTEQTCWLLHHDSMNYKAFAILTMDALVSLVPNWDGSLYHSPVVSSDVGNTCHAPETIDANQINSLFVSDASTSAGGRLWFQVTIDSHSIDSHSNEIDTPSHTVPMRSGWISSTIQV